MCGWIRSEEQYEAFVRLEAQKKGKQIQKQVPFHGGDDIGDLKEQLAEVKQRLDSVVNEVWKMKMQTDAWPLGDVRLRQDSVSELSRIWVIENCRLCWMYLLSYVCLLVHC